MPASQDLSAFYPELWADDALEILRDSLVMGNLVRRVELGGSNNVGDTVNFQAPGTFSAADVTIGTAVTVQSSTVTQVQLVLTAHKAAPFAIYDVEKAKSKDALIDIYVKPAVQAIAESIEDALMDEYANFTGTAVGTYTLGDYVSDLDIPTMWRRLATANAPMPWNAVMHPINFENLLKPVSDRENIFLKQDFPSGTAMSVLQAYMGTKAGIRFFASNRVNANTSTSPDEYSNMLFSQETIALAMANLPDSAAPGSAMVRVSDGGFSLRIEVAREASYSRDMIKVEALFGTKCLRPATGFEIKSGQ